ncbi:MAG: hypothetical protein HQK53_16295 [Oligoflexia bacterium]|nr:hypothetical protein [Oligoflexia bacterium]
MIGYDAFTTVGHIDLDGDYLIIDRAFPLREAVSNSAPPNLRRGGQWGRAGSCVFGTIADGTIVTCNHVGEGGVICLCK